MKLIAIFSILRLICNVESVAVTCSYDIKNWPVLGDVCTCTIRNFVSIITKDSAIIHSINPQPNETVKVFYAIKLQIFYFPRNLDKLFPSLDGIRFYNCDVKEISKKDLRPFPQLRYISFYINHIEVLEKDLFVFNPHLEFVGFYDNKISFIDPNVFDHLHKLSYLWLDSNKCISKVVENDTDEVRSLISEIKTQCARSQSTSTTTTTDAPTFFIDDQMTWLQANINAAKEELEASMKQVQEELKTDLKMLQTDMNARMSALEAMAQKILEMVENLTNVVV